MHCFRGAVAYEDAIFYRFFGNKFILVEPETGSVEIVTEGLQEPKENFIVSFAKDPCQNQLVIDVDSPDSLSCF